MKKLWKFRLLAHAHVCGVVSHGEEVGCAHLPVRPRPGEVHQLGGLHGAVVLELEQRQLPRYLDRVMLKIVMY